jgi:hypothetical protein
LYSLLRQGRLTPPPKDGSGDYVWSQHDLDNARAALAAVSKGRRKAAASADAE